jgi:hypothetical protein
MFYVNQGDILCTKVEKLHKKQRFFSFVKQKRRDIASLRLNHNIENLPLC